MKYLFIVVLFFTQLVFAESFSHLDWELTCDNTLTCRAAGYNKENDDLLVSVLLVRKAGEHSIEPVRVRLVNKQMDYETSKNLKLTLVINQHHLGQVVFDSHTKDLTLSRKQTNALVKSLLKNSIIIFEDEKNKRKWQLSDKGAKAVLLKMDDLQGRIKTKTAIVKKGRKSIKLIKKPLAIPVINVPTIPKTSKSDKASFLKHQKEIFTAIKKITPKEPEDCYGLYDDELSTNASIHRLTETKILVSSTCWMAAYNMGRGYWILNDTPPYSPQLVTYSATEYDNGRISNSQKGRGVGDCWSFESHTWNGHAFVLSNEGTSGMCRGFPGGAWILPSFVSKLNYQ